MFKSDVCPYVSIHSSCPAGTCDGCTFHFLWQSASACPRCTEDDYHRIDGACRGGTQVRHPCTHARPLWSNQRLIRPPLCLQETLYVWNEPKLCTGGVTLPPRSSSPCEAITLWLKVGVGGGAFLAVLLIALTCYFWKKNKRSEPDCLHCCFVTHLF